MANSFDEELESPEMETLASLAENLVYRLPGCTDIMVRKVLREVYRDFCRRSCCLRVRRHLMLDPEQEDISCQGINGGIVDVVTYVNWNRRRLVEDRDYRVVGFGKGMKVVFDRRLVPPKGCAEECLPRVEVEFVIVPDNGSETAPGWFISRFGDAICSGALYRLMSMTGKAWSDSVQASQEMINYNNAITEERARYYADVNTAAMNAIPNDELL